MCLCVCLSGRHLSAALISEFDRGSGDGEGGDEGVGADADVDGDGAGHVEAEAGEREQKEAEGETQRRRGGAHTHKVNRRLAVEQRELTATALEADEAKEAVEADEKHDEDEDEDEAADEEERDQPVQSTGDDSGGQRQQRRSNGAREGIGATVGATGAAAKRSGGGRKKRPRYKLTLRPRQANKRSKASSGRHRHTTRRAGSSKQAHQEAEAESDAEQEEEEDVTLAEDEWEVEAVVDSRKDRRGHTEYRLKWKRVDEGEEEAEDGDEQSYQWVNAADCHCLELINDYLHRRQERQQQLPAVGRVVIELVDELESYQTAILIEDVTHIAHTALLAIDAATSGGLDNSGGLVEESDAVTVRVTEDGDDTAAEDEEEQGGDEHGNGRDSFDDDDEDPADSNVWTKPWPDATSSASASLASSASAFVRRSMSPMVTRVNAVLSAFHRAPADLSGKQPATSHELAE